MALRPTTFYGASQGPLGYRPYDPRRSLAEILLQQGASAEPVQSITEGAARAGQMALGGYFAGQARRDDKEREDRYSRDIASALMGAQAKPWVNPDTGAPTIARDLPAGVQGPPQMVPTAPSGGMKGVIAALARTQNPDLAPFMQQAQLADIGNDQALALARENRAYEADQRHTMFDEQERMQDRRDATAATRQNALFKQQDEARAASEAAADRRQRESLDAAKDNRNVQTVTTADGVYVLNKDGTRGTRIGDAPATLAQEMQKIKQMEKEEEKSKQEEEADASLDITIRSVDELIDHPGRLMATGTTSFVPSMLSGSDRRGFDAKLDTLKAQVFLPMVAKMKGMGQLSDAEGRKISDAVGALNPSMGEAEFMRSLKQIKADFMAAKARAYTRQGKALPDDFAAAMGQLNSELAATGATGQPTAPSGSIKFLGFE